jgi:Nif-specific regulatory protein
MTVMRTGRDPLEFLHHVQHLTSTHDGLDLVLGPILRGLDDLMGLSRATLTVRDVATDTLRIEATHGLTPAETRRIRYQLGEGVTGRVALDGEPHAVPKISENDRLVDKLGGKLSGLDGSFVIVPVRRGSQVVGTLGATRLAPQEPTLQHDIQLLSVVAGLIAPLVDRRMQTSRHETPQPSYQPSNLIGRSKVMRQVYELVGQVADSSTTVLLRGESGTGKELVAQALHAGSDRARQTFIKVNCAALPSSIIESELFGHERGSFTGAIEQRRGRFELASGGTIFLDEIGDLSPSTQVKLLRVLQEREIERVGSARTIPVDVRVIAATSRDLESMMDTHAFRPDLYYRLNVFPIRLPALRDRRADVLLLADHFVEHFSRAHGRSVRRIATGAIDLLMAYHWPGNVRELENSIERAVLLTRGDVLMAHHLPPTLQGPTADRSGSSPGLEAALGAVERDLLLDALKACRGNMAAAARQLEITERQMGLRVKKYGVDPKRFKQRKGNPT